MTEETCQRWIQSTVSISYEQVQRSTLNPNAKGSSVKTFTFKHVKQSLVQDREVTLSRKASCVKIGDISNTLSCQRYSHSRPNHQIQVYKIKHLDMQTAATTSVKSTGCSQELRGLQRATVIGRCNKSSHEISSLLNVPQSAVISIITKWKRLGTTANPP